MSNNKAEQENDNEKKDYCFKVEDNVSGTIGQYNYFILSDDYPENDLKFKVIVIGDCGVGKTCLTSNAIKNIFTEHYNATIGFEFCTFNIKLEEIRIKLQVWDTCGQELYNSLITNFYRNTSLAIIVFSVTDEDSFNHIEKWIRDLRKFASPDIKIILIGNKIDLAEKRKITKEQGEKLCKENNFLMFIEASAKTGFNAQYIFIKTAQILYDEYKEYQNKGKINNENEDITTISSSKFSQKFSHTKKEDKSLCC